MDFNKYLNLAKRTMSKKGITISVKSTTENLIIARMALGVTGEGGEIAEKINNYLYGDIDFVESRVFISKEIGDTLWYLAMLCSSEYGFNLDFNEVSEEGFLELTGRDINKNGIFSDLIIARMALEVVSNTGKIAERIKKYLRGDKNFKETRELISKEIGIALKCLIILCDEFNLDFNIVAEENIKKLADRQKRGKLKGNGDER